MLDEPECGRLELVLTVVGAKRGAVWRAQMAHARHGSGTLGVGPMMMSTVDLVSFVLAALPPPRARVLEVGCGAGALARAVDNAGYRVLAIDPEAPEGPI